MGSPEAPASTDRLTMPPSRLRPRGRSRPRGLRASASSRSGPNAAGQSEAGDSPSRDDLHAPWGQPARLYGTPDRPIRRHAGPEMGSCSVTGAGRHPGAQISACTGVICQVGQQEQGPLLARLWVLLWSVGEPLVMQVGACCGGGRGRACVHPGARTGRAVRRVLGRRCRTSAGCGCRTRRPRRPS
jgi:hypothetical protein